LARHSGAIQISLLRADTVSGKSSSRIAQNEASLLSLQGSYVTDRGLPTRAAPVSLAPG